MEFEIIDHPADIGFKVLAENLNEGFEKAGQALFSLMVECEGLTEDEEMKVSIESEDLLSLLYDYLERLLLLFETEDFVASAFDVAIEEDHGTYRLDATIGGRRAQLAPGRRRYDIKAVTYHMMKVEDTGCGWLIQAIVDI